MDISALVLADSRYPGGGHVHSGGLEEAVSRGLVRGERELPGFLLGRLRTAGELAAVFAAAAALLPTDWAGLDAELDARTPSPAQRTASRAQGRGTMRAGVRAWPSPVLDALLSAVPRPHHPITLGALTGVAGGSPADAAAVAGYLAVSGPASAAVRLLGLDPFAVNAMVADLSAELRTQATRAAATAALPAADLPAPGSPGLDLLAEAHARHHKEEVRLFAS
ncbi:Urease accessory protein UreF [Actinokineospora spheciospongiae]|uniref:Urease accessory protein UreF n=1 Tax=Actinokineospora spheciospongiae TaxID=909613 RepID=W7IHD0_9PSEU|nr:urease accessory UreF family protein [Actinokineospora spheciospongiae]EWC60305.1 Urease accessory protein UreF [Actinokineospora spheciospongiae]